ncbi:hypothetical protein N692_01945 [Lactiplantibacillus plantarum EGD-AQ4]|nr:hypothetical protein N692_01945 [Lactiplantibacillus plantarum EGD-AQ4]
MTAESESNSQLAIIQWLVASFFAAIVMNDNKKVRIVWFTVRLPVISLFRLPGPADNAGTGRTSI